jgi:signal transduction histidine kinase
LRAAAIAVAVDASTPRTSDANAGEIGLVLLNLLLNAEQALVESGTASPAISVRVFDVGGIVRCEVADNGPGVRPEDEPKLFQPFSTSRPFGTRTGLGLSTSYGIVRSYGGTIGYHRNETGGATFFFELPAVRMEDDVQDRAALLQRSPDTLV